MLSAKRVIITTLCGVLFGFVCLGLATMDPGAEPLSGSIKVSIVLGRIMLGFMLGISALRLSWWLHGIVIGIIASIPMAVPIVPDWNIAISTVVMGIIYGFLTELITSKLFKSPPVGTLKVTA
ncbi:hypothetical protein GF407_18970 [candidate division KSB1 bacterium]|nr:hypothetical protein [candidate division KSB1 bacterium]